MLRVGTAKGLFVERPIGPLSLGRLFGGEVLGSGRLFITVIFVAERRGTIGRAHRQIHALAASVAIRELSIEVVGIGGILVPQPIPAFPESVDIGVMEIENWV